MTTSYESEQATVGGQPNYNSDGNQVWKPEVGVYHKPAFGQAQSYGGIVGAFQDLMVEEGHATKSYPHNFAGIIAAIQDLAFAQKAPPVIPGPDPGNGEIIIDIEGKPNWNIHTEMDDGSLWFDTRQGRLFVSLDNQWYQTNGADGLPIVTNTGIRPGVEHPVPGQFWWDSSNNDLYVFDGIFALPSGGFTDDPTSGGEPVWKLITDGLADAFQSTQTLPLGMVSGKMRSVIDFNIITQPDPTLFKVQSDYNIWLYDALHKLDETITEDVPVQVGTSFTGIPKAGDLWYDTTSLEMSIWYEDDDSAQWVPTFAAFSYDEDLDQLDAKLTAETRIRETTVNNIYKLVNQLQSGEIPNLELAQTRIANIEDQLNAIPAEPDLSRYATTSSVTAEVGQLNAKINAVNSSLGNISTYATASALQQLQAVVNQLPTTAAVSASIAAAQPNLSSYTTQSDINTSISNITTEYLPRTGGTLSGAFIMNKTDLANPSFDFSQEKWYSYRTQKYRTNSTADNYVYFGTNERPWEYAWDFSSEEDFCWVYNNSNKVFSITKEGPACSSLVIGDFSDNTDSGRSIRNKIDVKDRLVKYQFAFETMRQGVANATDFDSLKSNILTALASI